MFDTELVIDLEKRIEARLAQLPPSLHGQVTGNSILMAQVVDNLIWGQVQSIIGAIVMIYVLLWVMFLSPWLGLVALIPNMIPVAVYFGALGLTGITLNFATSIIAPMALGVAIDDTVHYFVRFNIEAKRLADERQATINVLRSVGRPVLYSTISLCVGFLTMAWSDLLSYRQVGGMAAFTLGFSLFVEVTLTPALCAGLRIVTLWDTLSLDLGESPQDSIPLFRGLSVAQCRMVALMASLRSVARGHAAHARRRTGPRDVRDHRRLAARLEGRAGRPDRAAHVGARRRDGRRGPVHRRAQRQRGRREGRAAACASRRATCSACASATRRSPRRSCGT